MKIIEQASRLHRQRQAEAAEVYAAALHGGAQAPTEQDAERLLAALALLGISVAEAEADAQAMRQRTILESRKAEAERTLSEAPGRRLALQKLADDFVGGRGGRPVQRHEMTTIGVDEQSAGLVLEKVKAQLRDLLIAFPRTFGAPPTATDLADRVAGLEQRR